MTNPPRDPPPGDPDDLPSEAQGGDGEANLRGWIDPDDRLWRHPSELAATGTGRATGAVFERSSPNRQRLMLVVGVAAAAAAVAWIVVLLSPASDRPPTVSTSEVAADSPMTTLAASQRTVPVVAQSAGHAMVQLRADTSHGVVLLTGVAVAEGGLVATTADALSGLRSLAMVGPAGKLLPAKVMGSDEDSDVALVTVPDDVPVATFADDVTLSGGSPDLTLTLAGSSGGVPTLHCETGLVSAVGTPVTEGPADGMPSIVSASAGGVSEAGDPLLNSSGAVVGLLYATQPTAAGPATVTYLPSQLILGVADDLRSTGRVSGGWLGVVGTNSPATAGALVTGLKPGSPAAVSLHPGEVIVGVNSMPVRTMAELRSRVYVLAPNATVALSVLDGTAQKVVVVTLGSDS